MMVSLSNIFKSMQAMKDHTNNFSSTTCEELVHLMERKFLNETISRLKKFKYYLISLGSTLDESHVDQLTLAFRFMEDTTLVERFVSFKPRSQSTRDVGRVDEVSHN